jgi:dihydropteroate synthase
MANLPSRFWAVGGKELELDRPRIMAILNLTPDSFFDGGRLGEVEDVVAAARRAILHGADMLDIGGESTRPGASRIPGDIQIQRIVPAIAALRAGLEPGLQQIPISVDTTLAGVAAAALDAGADAINDVSAGLEDPELLPLVARRGAGIILMHRLDPPQRDSYSDRYTDPPRYADVVAEVREFLAARIDAARRAGIAPESIVIDPGLGFGKTVEQNLELVRRSGELLTLGHPLLSAASRKSFVGRAMGLERSAPAERLPGSIALSLMHMAAGARLFRVHDVAEQAQALRAAWAAAPAGITTVPA